MSTPAFHPLDNQYPSYRRAVYGSRGMVCTTQPLAAQTGLAIMKQGGNAIDAAIATAIAMTVLEPTSNGIGSDTFALVWTKDGLSGLNGSGPAPQAISRKALTDRGFQEMPMYGWPSVTVPGTPASWAALSQRFGRLPFDTLFRDAIDYAENGFLLQPVTAYHYGQSWNLYREALKGGEFQPWFDTFGINGRPPRPGELIRFHDHGRTLRSLAASGCRDFYEGRIAELFISQSQKWGGYFQPEDLSGYRPEWVEPVTTNYKGYDVWEIPPNGHGITALMALNILEGFDLPVRDAPDSLHIQLEAMKLAYSDGKHYIGDPRYMEVSPAKLLSKEYAARRRQLIGREAMMPMPGFPGKSGTIYLCTADNEGNMVSYIQSNYRGFGSGLVLPGTGIALNDRGNNFSMDCASPNVVAPGKKPYHTIIPGFLTKDGEAIGPFGVMGGFMQPQGHVQVILNTIDFQMNPQEALDAPRWQWIGDKKIELESTFSPTAIAGLMRKGHEVTLPPENSTFGRGQIIWRTAGGGLIGGTESRADGCVAAW